MQNSSRDSLNRKIVGAVAAALVMSTLFTLFEYSEEGPGVSDFLKELAAALVSYGSAALLIHYWSSSRAKLLYDVFFVSLLGSLGSFLIKVTVLERQNGLPEDIAHAMGERSLKPIIDLVTHGFSSSIFETLVSLPFVAIGVWIWTVWTRKVGNANYP
jgi:hypothetical protein